MSKTKENHENKDKNKKQKKEEKLTKKEKNKNLNQVTLNRLIGLITDGNNISNRWDSLIIFKSSHN